jgi:hypothetical protein
MGCNGCEQGLWQFKSFREMPIRKSSSSDRASTLNNADEYHDYRYYKQDVNQAAESVGADHPEQPQNQKQGNDSPKHRRFIPF